MDSKVDFSLPTFMEKWFDPLLPNEFFQIKAIAKPKIPRNTMAVAATAAYVFGFGIFVAVFLILKQQTTTETKIETSDISGSDQWSCAMASIVTNNYYTNLSTEPLPLYQLISVSELKSACSSDLTQSQPCRNGNIYIPGDSTIEYNLQLYSASPYGNEVVYFLSLSFYNDQLVNAYRYDLSAGSITQSSALSFYLYEGTTSAAIGYDGIGYFINSDFSNMISSFDDNGSPCEVLPSEYSYYDVYYLTNDNRYFLWLLYFGKYSSSPDNPGYPATTVLYVPRIENQYLSFAKIPTLTLLNIEAEYLAVFVSDTNVIDFYFTLDIDDQYGIYHYRMLSASPTTSGTVFLSTNNLTLLTAGSYTNLQLDITGTILYASSTTVYDLLVFNITEFYQNGKNSLLAAEGSFAVNAGINAFSIIYSDSFNASVFPSPINSNITTVTTLQKDVTRILFYSQPLSSFGTLYVTNLNSYQTVQKSSQLFLLESDMIPINYGYKDTSVGWFFCGSSALSVLPSAVGNTGASFCSSNGLSWQLLYTKNYYYPAKQMQFIAESIYNASCMGQALYETICDTVGDQPPYICTRNVHTSVLQALSSAIAAGHYVTIIFIFVTSCSFSSFASTEKNISMVDEEAKGGVQIEEGELRKFEAMMAAFQKREREKYFELQSLSKGTHEVHNPVFST